MKKTHDSRKSKIRGFPYPSEIIELRKGLQLSMYEVLLLHTLKAAMNPKNTICWRTQETLAEEMGCSRYTVMRAGNSLKDRGIIEVTQEASRRKHGQASFEHNVYRLLSPWSEESRFKQVKKLEETRKKEATLHAERHLPCRSQQHPRVAHSNTNQSKKIDQRVNISREKTLTQPQLLL